MRHLQERRPVFLEQIDGNEPAERYAIIRSMPTAESRRIAGATRALGNEKVAWSLAPISVSVAAQLEHLSDDPDRSGRLPVRRGANAAVGDAHRQSDQLSIRRQFEAG